jgi:hypothetical protein
VQRKYSQRNTRLGLAGWVGPTHSSRWSRFWPKDDSRMLCVIYILAFLAAGQAMEQYRQFTHDGPAPPNRAVCKNHEVVGTPPSASNHRIPNDQQAPAEPSLGARTGVNCSGLEMPRPWGPELTREQELMQAWSQIWCKPFRFTSSTRPRTRCRASEGSMPWCAGTDALLRARCPVQTAARSSREAPRQGSHRPHYDCSTLAHLIEAALLRPRLPMHPGDVIGAATSPAARWRVANRLPAATHAVKADLPPHQ